MIKIYEYINECHPQTLSVKQHDIEVVCRDYEILIRPLYDLFCASKASSNILVLQPNHHLTERSRKPHMETTRRAPSNHRHIKENDTFLLLVFVTKFEVWLYSKKNQPNKETNKKL